MGTEQIIQADWTWTGAAFEREVQIVVTGDGQVEVMAIGPTGREQRLAASIPTYWAPSPTMKPLIISEVSMKACCRSNVQLPLKSISML